MNGKQRIHAAMRHEPVDRVPVMCQLALGHYLLHTDLAPTDVWYTSEGFAEALVTLDPPPLGTVDLEDAKRRVGDRLFFKGNIDPVHTLLNRTREEVRADALQRLEVGSPGSGYILSSACSVSPRVKPENLTVLVEASEQFGRPK